MGRLVLKSFLVLLVFCGSVLFLLDTRAHAIPSFARQTGLACSACHTIYPQLTALGRQFKLNGYTMTTLEEITAPSSESSSGIALAKVLPLSFVFQGTSTATNRSTPDHQNWDVNFPQEAGVYLAGEITPHIGGFLQLTYAQADGRFMLDMTDFRYANHLKIGNADTIYGLTVNNGPTIEDVWNATPAFAFPFVGSETAPAPAAGPFISTLVTDSVGAGPYVYWNDHLYLGAAVYRTVHQGQDPGSKDMSIKGPALYWRAAWNQDFGAQNVEVGTFGLVTQFQPDGAVPDTDRHTDIGADAQVQASVGASTFDARFTYIHDTSHWHATTASNASDKLQSFQVNGDWLYGYRFGFSAGYFLTMGDRDCLLYGGATCGAGSAIDGSRSGSPLSNGEVFELDYLPWQNTKFSLQYVIYNMFNGAHTNYDGLGRDASDNNTLFLDAMMSF